MRSFGKYFFWGLLGLILNLSCPRLAVDWLAIVWVFAYLGSPKKSSAWFCLAALTLGYGAFSLSPAWQLAFPLAVAAVIDAGLQRNLSMDSQYRRFLLLVFCEAGRLLLWSAVGGLAGAGWIVNFYDGLWVGITLLMGLVLLPAASWFLSRLLRRLSWFGHRARGVDLSRADWLSDRAGRLVRKPFGLEKGI